MVPAFSRISAIVDLKVGDYIQQRRRAKIRIHIKGGVEIEIPVHHQLAEYLDVYIRIAGIEEDKNEYLFRSARGRSKVLSTNRMSRIDAWKMVQRRLGDAGIGGAWDLAATRFAPPVERISSPTAATWRCAKS